MQQHSQNETIALISKPTQSGLNICITSWRNAVRESRRAKSSKIWLISADKLLFLYVQTLQSRFPRQENTREQQRACWCRVQRLLLLLWALIPPLPRSARPRNNEFIVYSPSLLHLLQYSLIKAVFARIAAPDWKCLPLTFDMLPCECAAALWLGKKKRLLMKHQSEVISVTVHIVSGFMCLSQRDFLSFRRIQCSLQPDSHFTPPPPIISGCWSFN